MGHHRPVSKLIHLVRIMFFCHNILILERKNISVNNGKYLSFLGGCNLDSECLSICIYSYLKNENIWIRGKRASNFNYNKFPYRLLFAVSKEIDTYRTSWIDFGLCKMIDIFSQALFRILMVQDCQIGTQMDIKNRIWSATLVRRNFGT